MSPTRHDHWIGGSAVPPAGGEYLPTIDPTTREPGDEIAAGTPADVERAVRAAADAQAAWAGLPAGERAAVLERIGRGIAERRDEFIRLEGAATGKVPAQLDTEIDMSAAYFTYYAGVLRTHAGRTIDQGAGTHTYTRLEPYGVVGIITPWNLPLNQAARACAPAIAVGNAVIAKPSEFTSTTTVRLAQVATEAGLPDGIFNVVTGTGPDVGTPLVTNPGLRRIAFTGSVATGRALAGLAAERGIPVTLELGGKSPLVVFADADLERAVAAAAASAVMNAGQVCSATTRLLVEESVHDHVIELLAKALEQKQPGVDFGPMITEAQYDKVLHHLADARAAGLEPVTGGDTYADGPAAQGLYIQPTVFARVDPDATIAREEIFGPVLVTMAFEDETEALRRANDTEYGLVGAVWSGDLARGIRVAERIDAGQIAVNGGPLTIETPFGGFKNSGYGREKGLEALHDYSQVKSVSIALR